MPELGPFLAGCWAAIADVTSDKTKEVDDDEELQKHWMWRHGKKAKKWHYLDTCNTGTSGSSTTSGVVNEEAKIPVRRIRHCLV